MPFLKSDIAEINEQCLLENMKAPVSGFGQADHEVLSTVSSCLAQCMNKPLSGPAEPHPNLLSGRLSKRKNADQVGLLLDLNQLDPRRWSAKVR